MAISRTTIESAASQTVYQDLEKLAKGTDLGTTRAELAGYRVAQSFVEASDGLQGYALENRETGDIIIAFRGTYAAQDVIDDVSNLGWRQWETAKSLGILEYVSANVDKNITFTGHSLGGGLAQYAVYETVSRGLLAPEDINLVTFNALGAVAGLEKNVGYDATLLDGITGAHYFNPEDLVMQLTTHVGPATYEIPDVRFGPDGFYGAHEATQFDGGNLLTAFLSTPDYLDADSTISDPLGGGLAIIKDIGVVIRYTSDPTVAINNDVREAFFRLSETADGLEWVIKMTRGMVWDFFDLTSGMGSALRPLIQDRFSKLLSELGLGFDSQPVTLPEVPPGEIEVSNGWVYGNSGTDYMWASDDRPFNGLGGDDFIYSRGGTGLLVGGSGNDLIVGYYLVDDKLAGGAGNDKISGGGGNDRMDGGSGNDHVDGDGGDDLAVGGSGTDTLIGGTGNDFLSGGTEDDLLIGEEGNDLVNGDDGNDTLLGEAGNDVLVGGKGNDSLDGGSGADLLDGGHGDDTYRFVESGDRIVESGGFDTIVSGVSMSIESYTAVEGLTLDDDRRAIYGVGNSLDNVVTGNSHNNLLKGGAGSDTLIGDDGDDKLEGGTGSDTLRGDSGTWMSAGDDILLGGSGEDILDGGYGADVLDGGYGVDILDGGYGDDTYVMKNEYDKIIDLAGRDTITSTITRSLLAYAPIENLTLLGSANINGTGNSSGNVITGNSGNNTLDGRQGNDTLVGGAGNDTYALGNESDKVVDTSGIDTITTTISRFLSAYTSVENLILLGRAYHGAGNSLNNVITGNSYQNVLSGAAGNDTLNAGAGDDTLDGGTGVDVLDGGTGNDWYRLGTENDKVIDSGGHDLIESSVSRSLASYSAIEDLWLAGRANINGTGNSLNNLIEGNSGSNILSGGAGNDRLVGGGGNDRLMGGTGNDVLIGSAGRDVFVFNSAPNAKNNVDHVEDFGVVDDSFWFENSLFKGLGKDGTLLASAFRTNFTGLAHDASDRLIYERDTGELYYDGDGNGRGAGVLVAVLDNNLSLAHSDFFVI